MFNAPITIPPNRRLTPREDVAQTAPVAPTSRVRPDRALEGREGQRESAQRSAGATTSLAPTSRASGGRQRIGTIIDDYA
ncbi:hypothetical protein H0Z60_02270 [Ectothiorhodospiraceae bacterium WFHF3C12]|nr:hypothetical protein [Ectothiorhodospiraceae bacterium WFHF3C12]